MEAASEGDHTDACSCRATVAGSAPTLAHAGHALQDRAGPINSCSQQQRALSAYASGLGRSSAAAVAPLPPTPTDVRPTASDPH